MNEMCKNVVTLPGRFNVTSIVCGRSKKEHICSEKSFTRVKLQYLKVVFLLYTSLSSCTAKMAHH